MTMSMTLFFGQEFLDLSCQGRECGSMKKRRTRICRVPPCDGSSEDVKDAARSPKPFDNNCVIQFGASYRFNNDATKEFEHRSVQLYTGFEGGQPHLLVSNKQNVLYRWDRSFTFNVSFLLTRENLN